MSVPKSHYINTEALHISCSDISLSLKVHPLLSEIQLVYLYKVQSLILSIKIPWSESEARGLDQTWYPTWANKNVEGAGDIYSHVDGSKLSDVACTAKRSQSLK